MISFNEGQFHRTRDGGVYLKYEDIERLTEEILLDYDDSLLCEPRAIEYDDFLESYLGASISYQDIYCSAPGNAILGCTVFNKQAIPIYDKEKMRKTYIECEPRTVVLDNVLINGNRIVQENITGLHEGGHLWLHVGQLTEAEGQMSLGDYKGIICCRKSEVFAVDELDTYKPSNAEMWREYQANVFAVTIALPRKSLEISVGSLFKQYGIDGGALVIDADPGAENLAEHIIPEELKRIYNMSKESIRYRLMKVGFYKTKKEYEEEQRYVQISLFDF